MELKHYFDGTRGLGVLSTAASDGAVNSAIYATPHVLDEHTVAFIMNDRLTHRNLDDNPRAHYLFREDRPGYHGIRLRLTKLREERNTKLLQSLRRRPARPDRNQQPKDLYLVYFAVEERLPLVSA